MVTHLKLTLSVEALMVINSNLVGTVVEWLSGKAARIVLVLLLSIGVAPPDICISGPQQWPVGTSKVSSSAVDCCIEIC